MSKRVLLAGLFHETHTFLDERTSLSDFEARRGEEIFSARGDGSPLSGVLEVADENDWEVLPVIDMRATPSGTVEDEVVEEFWREFETAATNAIKAGIDGIFLVLHGAMTCQSFPDVEGEIIRRIRTLDGAEKLPICGVLDLHGNISQAMTEQSQGFVVYRCNPHIDSRDACMNAARLLNRILETGVQPEGVWNHPAIMWPPTGTGTADDPMRTLEAMAREIEASHTDIYAINVFGGYSFADTPDTGVCFTAITFGDVDVTKQELAQLSEWAVAHREEGNVLDLDLQAALPEVLAHIEAGNTPVVIVEPADNIGGAGPGDATTLLSTFIEHKIENAAVVINDPEVAKELHTCNVGESVVISLGGKANRLTAGPVDLEVELISKSDGKFELEDHNSHLASMYGIHINMGLSATVRYNGLWILVTTRKTPPFDLGQLRSQGIIPEEMTVIGVKAAVAHRRAYEKIQKASYTVSTPGPCSSDLKTFPFEKVGGRSFHLKVDGLDIGGTDEVRAGQPQEAFSSVRPLLRLTDRFKTSRQELQIA